MPLSMARAGEMNTVKKISGKDDVRRFLASLGFVEGGNVTVVSEVSGDLIVNVKDARVAISRTQPHSGEPYLCIGIGFIFIWQVPAGCPGLIFARWLARANQIYPLPAGQKQTSKPAAIVE